LELSGHFDQLGLLEWANVHQELNVPVGLLPQLRANSVAMIQGELGSVGGGEMLVEESTLSPYHSGFQVSTFLRRKASSATIVYHCSRKDFICTLQDPHGCYLLFRLGLLRQESQAARTAWKSPAQPQFLTGSLYRGAAYGFGGFRLVRTDGVQSCWNEAPLVGPLSHFENEQCMLNQSTNKDTTVQEKLGNPWGP
jgi:hypothetical protein